ncbi:MAG: dTMP kinase [Candidatus Omnitrophica bacterium]|nr:dTMP kinase [Candidatus Omnitrophota bacterium]MCM8790978.1 dTMP kinase [Candidatus Omnitrophota bacterium]
MAKKGLKKGLFITFEGPEGCGKSTHSRLICGYLRGLGYDCVHTREPGGTKLGERIRGVLLHSDGVAISDLAELFLFEAARSQIVKEVITPALSKGKIVVCDRFSDATFSYQGYGGGVSLAVIKALDKIATESLKPNLTILLDIDPVTGLRRARQKGIDRMEEKTLTYHRRVRSGYLKLAAAEPQRIKVIKVAASISETQRMVRREVEDVIQRYKRAK